MDKKNYLLLDAHSEHVVNQSIWDSDWTCKSKKEDLPVPKRKCCMIYASKKLAKAKQQQQHRKILKVKQKKSERYVKKLNLDKIS